jgi:MFS family permease
VELATLLAFFEGLAQETRTSVLALYNLGSAAAIALGSLIGAALFASLEGSAPAYAALFVVSSLLRAASLPLLRRMARGPAVTESLELSTLAVRPSLGALQRPIASSLDPVEAAPD